MTSWTKIPQPVRAGLRAVVLDRDGHRCQVPQQDGHLCGAVATTADHVVPASKGGDHTVANLRAACWRCNSERRDRDDPPTPRSWTWNSVTLSDDDGDF
jgi:5-methylcytosine-specific restriction endonuclease McrA